MKQAQRQAEPDLVCFDSLNRIQQLKGFLRIIRRRGRGCYWLRRHRRKQSFRRRQQLDALDESLFRTTSSRLCTSTCTPLYSSRNHRHYRICLTLAPDCRTPCINWSRHRLPTPPMMSDLVSFVYRDISMLLVACEYVEQTWMTILG